MWQAGQTGTMNPQLPPRELGLCTFLLIRLQCIRPWSKPPGPKVSAPVTLVIVSMEEGAGGRTSDLFGVFVGRLHGRSRFYLV